MDNVHPRRSESVGDRPGGQEGHVEVLSVGRHPPEILPIPVVVAADRMDVRPELVQQSLFLIRRSGRPTLRFLHPKGAAPHRTDATDPAEMGRKAAGLPMEGLLTHVR